MTSYTVFLKEDVAVDPSEAAEHIVMASDLFTDNSNRAVVGKIFSLARAFTVESNDQTFVNALTTHPWVKEVLKSEQDDILPKPI